MGPDRNPAANRARPPVMHSTGLPERIVCLSAESADWLWRLGAWDRVIGVTAYFAAPAEVPPKSRVSGFSSGRVDDITELNPDLVITFSDVQAALAAELIRRGLTVLSTNQRTLAETEATLALLGRVIGRESEAQRLLQEFRERLKPISPIGRRPRVYFEEWNEPLISGIAWISELIERAGGEDPFCDLRSKRAAAGRVVSLQQVRDANPELIFASWCGKPFDEAHITSRPQWNEIRAIRTGRVYAIQAEDILQPGFRLIYGYERLKKAIGQMRPLGPP
jgi:iron complex transport system substrate-binding protein